MRSSMKRMAVIILSIVMTVMMMPMIPAAQNSSKAYAADSEYTLTTDKTEYNYGEPIMVTADVGAQTTYMWVGLYREGITPSGNSADASIYWYGVQTGDRNGKPVDILSIAGADNDTGKNVTEENCVKNADAKYQVILMGDGGTYAVNKTVEITVHHIPVAGITLDKSALNMAEKNSATLTATITPDNAADKTVKWSSSDEAVATVAADASDSSKATVKGLKSGTTTITATSDTQDGVKTAECQVTVTASSNPAKSIALDQEKLDLTLGGEDSSQLKATIEPADSTDTVQWTSSDTNIATVDESGTVKAVGAGEADITAKAGDYTATCQVTVKRLFKTDKTTYTEGDPIKVTAYGNDPNWVGIYKDSDDMSNPGKVPSIYWYTLDGTNKEVSIKETNPNPTRTDWNLVKDLPAGVYNIYLFDGSSGKVYTPIGDPINVSIVAGKTEITPDMIHIENFTYDGTEKTPKVVVKDGDTTLTEGQDYTWKLADGADTVNAGTVKVIVNGVDSSEKYWAKNVEQTFEITGKPLTDEMVSQVAEKYAFTGKEIKPEITVKDGDKVLEENKDYTVTYPSGVDRYMVDSSPKVVISGIGNYSGNITRTFTVADPCDLGQHTLEPFDAEPATLTADGHESGYRCEECGKYFSDAEGTNQIDAPVVIPRIAKVSSDASLTYNGKTRKPSVKVMDAKGSLLKNGTDYTVSVSSGSKNVGKYKVTITFKGKYSGKKSATFKVIPKGTKIKRLSRLSRGFKASWSKQSAKMSKKRITGYQLRYSTKKTMKSAKYKTVKGYTKTSYKKTKLSKKKYYYVQVRTYQKVSGKNYYSKWSSVKRVKTK